MESITSTSMSDGAFLEKLIKDNQKSTFSTVMEVVGIIVLICCILCCISSMTSSFSHFTLLKKKKDDDKKKH